MARNSKSSKSQSHKAQKAQARQRAALKDRLLKAPRRKSGRGFGFLDEAFDLFEDGHYEEVRELLQSKFALNPQAETEDALELLGDAAIHLKDFITIAQAFRKLAARNPSEISFQVNYANSLMKLMLPVLAQKAFERLLQKWPNDRLTRA